MTSLLFLQLIEEDFWLLLILSSLSLLVSQYLVQIPGTVLFPLR